MEIWKEIPDWEGYYQVSSLGRVRNINTQRIKKLTLRTITPKIFKNYGRTECLKERFSSSLSKKDQARLDIVIKTSVNSNCKSRHAASVYRSGRLLAIGINKSRVNNKWHENLEGRPATIHAEIAALNQVEDATGCTIYVARTMRDGSSALSRPCNNCAKEIIRRGVKEVVYTT